MSHFAKVIDGIVTKVIVSEQDHIDNVESGEWTHMRKLFISFSLADADSDDDNSVATLFTRCDRDKQADWISARAQAPAVPITDAGRFLGRNSVSRNSCSATAGGISWRS